MVALLETTERKRRFGDPSKRPCKPTRAQGLSLAAMDERASVFATECSLVYEVSCVTGQAKRYCTQVTANMRQIMPL